MESHEKWQNSYNDEDISRRVLQAFHIFRRTNLFCDVILKMCGYEVPAHACILAAGSPYFNTFLSQPMPRQYSQIFPQLIEVHIDNNGDQNVHYEEAVYKVIDFLYTGRIEIGQGIIPQIREISKILQLEDLVNLCNDLLMNPGIPKHVTIPLINHVDSKKCLTLLNEQSEKVSVGTQADFLSKQAEEKATKIPQKCRKRKNTKPRKKTGKLHMLTDKSLPLDSDTEEDVYIPEEIVSVHPDDVDDKDEDFLPPRKAKLKVKAKGDIKAKKYRLKRRANIKKGSTAFLNCEECDFTTDKMRILAKHRDIHLNEKNICRFCDVRLDSQKKWEEHVQSHEGTHPYVCTFCDKTFKCR